MASAQASLSEWSAYYTANEVASHCGVDRTTVIKWFQAWAKSGTPIIQRPRAAGQQRPSMLIEESVLRRKFAEMGYRDGFIDPLVDKHAAECKARVARWEARSEAQRRPRKRKTRAVAKVAKTPKKKEARRGRKS